MKNIVFISIIFFVFHSFSFGQVEATTIDGKKVLLYDNGSWLFADSVPLYNIRATPINLLEIPKTTTKDVIITHSGYSLLYNDKHKQSNWVAYELTSEETKKIFDRTDKFLPDPQIKKKIATDKDYTGSGYDRGHLAPAADMEWSKSTVDESFYYSNICPQEPGFNRGIWKRLEELVRTWAIENISIYIVTGPVLSTGLTTIGNNKVSVPNYFYKVILDYTDPSIKGIGFIMSNSASSEPLQNYAVTIDSVEKFTGIDFFPSLSDEQENEIEKTLCTKCWTWNVSKTEDSKEKNSTSVQCNGKTKSGNRCKNKTLNASGFCYLHEGQDPTKSDTKKTDVKKTETPTGTTKSGQTIYTGPRGGKYHYSKSGNKVYEKKK